MTDRRRAFIATLATITAAMALLACSGGASEKPETVTPAVDDSANAALSYSVRRYVAGADQAVGLAFDNRGRLLYAEKDTGRIIRFSRGRKSVLTKLGVAGGGEAGLLGLAADSSGNVFASFTGTASNCPDPTNTSSGSTIEGHCVWRFTPTSNGRLKADGRVFSAEHPTSSVNHVGGGLHFGPDGALYLSIGDLGDNEDPDLGPGRAQSLSLPYGKILRLDPAGDNKAAVGNPSECGNADNSAMRKISDARIWACGVRNTYQFTFDVSGTMWGSEAGDTCDEINRVKAGVNYGWQPPRTDCSGRGAGRPVLKLSGTPSGITVPTSKAARGWRNDVFYCVFSGSMLMRYDRSRRKTGEVRKASGRCSYDLISRGSRLYMSSGEDIYRLSIKR